MYRLIKYSINVCVYVIISELTFGSVNPLALMARLSAIGLLVAVICRRTVATAVVCGNLPADKPWNVVSATRRNSSVAPRACVRVYARVCWCRRIFTYIHTYSRRGVVLVVFCSVSKPVSRVNRACVLVQPNLYIY